MGDDLFDNDLGGGSMPVELEPMYSALSSGHTIRHYQKQNNTEELASGL